MNKKVYYRFKLETLSALSIGAAESTVTDADVVLDGRGKPVIPASSLAGVLRHALDGSDSQQALFGRISKEESRDSLVKIYDAELDSGENISTRDNVALEKNEKIAAGKAKFDRQVVDKGACFLGFAVINGEAESFDAEAVFEKLLGKLGTGSLRLGSKTTRGLGHVGFVDGKYEKMTFGPEDVDSWLDFDMFDPSCWMSAEIISPVVFHEDEAVFNLRLSVNGALSIREYTTELPDEVKGLGTAPDYKQLTLAGEPIIPGTSWAGAFRSRIRQLEGKLQHEEDLFGTVGNKTMKSRIFFSESIVTGGEPKQITRNAIDRFTGGTLKTALFSELTHYNGTTSLEIRIRNPRTEDFPALIAAIADLNNGLLAVGGLTSVGHGLFHVDAAELTIWGNSIASFASTFGGQELVQPDIPAILKEIESQLSSLREGE